MKNQPFVRRLGFALAGWRLAFVGESSFRSQCLAAVLALAFTVWLRPAPLWWALVGMSIALVLGAELFNTALEHLADGLHPGQAEFVRYAKDCAAGAVLVFSASSLLVFALMLWATLGG
ncbi:MAG: hypothetical protein RIR00_2159 [Pseudomonadota bacterium]|jgi:diacylglycerol kinase (ATP)